MNVLNFLRALPDIFFTQDFLFLCVLVFFVCEALFKIPLTKSFAWLKPVLAIVVGALLGIARWGVTTEVIILGAIAGAVTTLAVARLDYWWKVKTPSMSKAPAKRK